MCGKCRCSCLARALATEGPELVSVFRSSLPLPLVCLRLYDRPGWRTEPNRELRGVSTEAGSKRLGIQVGIGPDATAEEVADATLELRRELLDLDVEAVETQRAGEPPSGTKGGDLAALGTLVVTLAHTQLLTSVLAAIGSWLAASRHRSIRLELGGDVLELSGLSSDEQRRLTDEWLRRHESR
jgi:hypothetical protein